MVLENRRGSGKDDIKAEYMPQNYEEILDLDMTPVDFLDKSGDKEESVDCNEDS